MSLRRVCVFCGSSRGSRDEYVQAAMRLTQLGLHRKRCGVLNVSGFYDSLLALFDRAVADDLLKPQNRRIVEASGDPVELLDVLAQPVEAPEPKWLDSPSDI